MDRRRKQREQYLQFGKGYYHLCFDHLDGGLMFNTDEAYRVAMCSVALITLKFPVKIYAFELMPNHLHIILSGTGEACCKAFSYLKRRISEQLLKEGYGALPAQLGFLLVPIQDRKQMQDLILYLLRNPYEKGYCMPGGHRWGSGYLLFNDLAVCLEGEKAGEMSARELYRSIHSTVKLPSEWVIHPQLGILPASYVCLEKVRQLFPSVKDLFTRAVKDYETFVRISDSVGEVIEFSDKEVKDIVYSESAVMYPGKMLKELFKEEKLQLAVSLNRKYHLDATAIAVALSLSAHLVRQALRSKDYGKVQ
ncbi:MAG: hypothetical protein J6M31_02265 [Bacteroidales bacterium]|nr:hypothetical protein [Bacteroidales bacterium]